MKNIKFIIAAFFISLSSLLHAQSHNEEVTVEGSYTPQIRKSERIAKTPDIPKRDFNIPTYEINTEDFFYTYKVDLEPISPLSYTNNKSNRITNNFVKAGFGTRLSPDFIFRHYSNITKKTSLGVGVVHNSTWLDMKDLVNTKYMNNAFNVSLTNRFSQFQLHSYIDYHYDMYYLNAGTNADIDSITIPDNDIENKRNIHSLNVKLKANNNKSSYKSLYDEFLLDYNFNYIQGGMQENHLKLTAHLEHSNSWFNNDNNTQTLVADIRGEVDYIKQALFLLEFNPHLDFDGDFYNLHLGLRLDIKTNSTSIGGIYPDIKGSLFLFKKSAEFYAGIGGETKINTLNDILKENPFIISNLSNAGEFDYEKTKIALQAGFKFKALNKISGNIGIRFRKIDNHIFYISSFDNPNTFDILLNNCNLFNFITDIQFQMRDNLRLSANFSYNKYDLLANSENIIYSEAWYKPEIEFAFKGIYMFDNHWSVNMSAYVEGYRYALINADQIEKLKPICDIQLGCDYKLDNNLTLYAEIKNLIHNKYQLYYNYPSYGIQGFIGFKYKFL